MTNEILHFDMKTLLDNSVEDNDKKMLIADQIISNRAINACKGEKVISLNRYTCQLFDQAQKALSEINKNDISLSDIFFIMDFKSCGNYEYNKLNKYENGIELNIFNKKIIVVDYLKSNSMSKESKIYYINKDYYDLINPRITFGIDKAKSLDLPKWYAYTGLAITDCHILDNIKLSADEVVIIDDSLQYINTDAFTAISIPSFFSDIDYILENKIYDEDVNYVLQKHRCYKNSKDFDSLPTEQKEIIDAVCNMESLSKDDYFSALFNLKKKYFELNNLNRYVKWEKINVEDFPIEVNLYDGEGLISLEFEEQINKELNGKIVDNLNESDNEVDVDAENYEYKLNHKNHSFQIRLPFVKGVVHSCDLKKFFRSHNIKYINGKTYSGDELRRYDVNKIKMILTNSQFKLAKFIRNLALKDNEKPIDAYFRLLKDYSYSLGISNVEPINKNEYVKLCYQFFSTMPLETYDSDEIIRSNQSYINSMTNIDTVISHIRDMNNQNNDMYSELLDIYNKQPDFIYNSSVFKNIRKRIFENEREKRIISKMSVLGTRKFLSSDLLGLLYQAANLELKEEDLLNRSNFYMPNEEYPNSEYYFALLRNPHYARNEIKMLKPEVYKNDERHKYFSHLTGVVMVNPYSLTAERLGGADYDGDTVIVTWQHKLVLHLYDKLYENGKEIYSLIKIPSIKTYSIKNTYVNKITSISKSFDSSVGKISDNCFIEAYKAYKEDRRDDIAFYTIINGLEIDSTKNGRKPKLPVLNALDEEAKLFIEIKNSYKKDEVIKEYLKKAKNYNSIIFKNLNSKFKLEAVKLNKPSIKKNIKLTKEDAIRIASIVNAYGSYMSSIRRYNNYAKNQKNENLEVMIKEANKLLELNKSKYYFDDLKGYFETKNPYNTLLSYLTERVYYASDLSKNEKLAHLGFDSLPNEIKDIVTNYNNEGFKLLYYLLYYHKEALGLYFILDKRDKADIDNGIFSKKDFNNALYDLSNDYGDDYLYLVGIKTLEHFSVIEDILNNVKDASKELNSAIKRINDYLLSSTKNYSIEDLARVCDVYETDVVFNIFHNQLKKYLLLNGGAK